MNGWVCRPSYCNSYSIDVPARSMRARNVPEPGLEAAGTSSKPIRRAWITSPLAAPAAPSSAAPARAKTGQRTEGLVFIGCVSSSARWEAGAGEEGAAFPTGGCRRGGRGREGGRRNRGGQRRATRGQQQEA